MFSSKIGIIGLGFVGGAIREAFAHEYLETVLIDSDPTRGNGTYEQLADCDGVFVCVPSPQGDDGVCDTSILESVLQKLKGYNGVIISKSTAPPDVYTRLGNEHPNLVHSPEFLTAANAVADYRNGSFCIIGGSVKAYMNEASRIIHFSQPEIKRITFCSIGEASLIKYTINTFLATKVIFMNEMYKLATTAGYNYDVIKDAIQSDVRIGNSHLKVPGPDGLVGFGGACFPKDTSALLKYAESLGVDMNVLNAAVKKNTLLRLQ